MTDGPVTYLGKTIFDVCDRPKDYKSEYGIDQLVRRFIGATALLADFLRTLKQGQRFVHNGSQWYLTSWEPDDGKNWSIVNLNYRGFCEGRAPAPRYDNAAITQNITVNATVGGEAVTREILYICRQTHWQFVLDRSPTGATIGVTKNPFEPIIISSVITKGDQVYQGALAPAPLVAATTPAVIDFVLDPTASQVFGTPFFECEEVVARMFIST